MITKFVWFLAAVVALMWLGLGFGTALADPITTSTIHDPSSAPLQAINDIDAAFHTGWALGVLVLAYVLIELAARAGVTNGIPALAKLGQGRVSIALAGATAVVASMINSLALGGPWSSVLITGAGAALGYWHPAGTAKSSAPPVTTPPAQKGFVRVSAVLALALCGVPLGCAWWASEKSGVAGDAINCLKSDASTAIKEFGPAIGSLVTLLTGGDGSIDTAGLKSATSGFAENVGGCVLADAFARAIAPGAGSAGSGAPKSSALVLSPTAARAAMASLYPGKHFHTAAGDL